MTYGKLTAPVPQAGANAPPELWQQISDLHNQNPWIPIQTVAALTQSGLSSDEINGVIPKLRQAAVGNDQQRINQQAVQQANPYIKQQQRAAAEAKQQFHARVKELGGRDNIGPQELQALRRQYNISYNTPQQTQSAGILQKAKDILPTTFGFQQFFDDPVLQKAPSAGLAIRQYLSGAIGPWPIKEEHLAYQQQQLQLRGYGVDLPVNGVQTPEWNNEVHRYAEDQYQSQLHGAKPGSVPTAKVLEAMNALLPVNVGNAVLAFAKASPNVVRDLMADMAGGTAGLGYTVLHPRVPFFSQSPEGEYQAAGQAAAQVKTLFGANTSTQTEAEAFQHQALGKLVNDIGTIFLLTSAMGPGTRFFNAIGGTTAALTEAEAAASGGVIARTLAGTPETLGEAYRGPGGIAGALFNPEGRAAIEAAGGNVASAALRTAPARVAVGAVLGGGLTATQSQSPGTILAGAATGGLAGYLTTTDMFHTFPVLRSIAPVVDGLADADGLYYKARRLVALPYQYKPVQVAGQTFQDVSMFGAKIQGTAAVEKALAGQPTPLSAEVATTKTLDTVDAALKNRLHFTAFGHEIAPSINDLMFMLHAGPHFSSENFGKGVDNMIDTQNRMLGDTDLNTAIHRITDHSAEKEFARFETPEDGHFFWNWKVQEHAVMSAAENQYNNEQADLGYLEPVKPSDRAKDIEKIADTIMKDPAQRKDAVTSFMGQGREYRLQEFVDRVKEEEVKTRSGFKGGNIGDAPSYVRAVRLAQQELVPFVDRSLSSVEPAGAVEYNAARAAGREHVAFDTPAETEAYLQTGPSQLHNTAFPNLHPDYGQLGVMNKEGWTTQRITPYLEDFRTRYEEAIDRQQNAQIAEGHPAGAAATRIKPIYTGELATLDDEVNRVLRRAFGTESIYMPQDLGEKLDWMDERSKLLPKDLVLHPDAPQSVVDAVAQMDAEGYKPIIGTDIGHYLAEPTQLDLQKGPLTWRRRLAQALQISPERIMDASPASRRKTAIIQAIWDAHNDPKNPFTLPPYFDPASLLNFMNRDGIIDQDPGFFKGAVEGALKTTKKAAAKRGITDPDEIAALQRDLHSAMYMPDINRKAFVEAMTRSYDEMEARLQKYGDPVPGTEGVRPSLAASQTAAQLRAGDLPDVPFMSKDSAEALYRAIVKGAADVPSYQLGANKLESLFRASMGFAGNGIPMRMGAGAVAGGTAAWLTDPSHPSWEKEVAGMSAGALAVAAGGDRLGWAMANLPNKLIQLRNELRFELDPMFSLRRIVKTNVKLATEGIPVVRDPFTAMERAGTTFDDQETLRRVLHDVDPRLADPYVDDANRYLKSQDVFNLYNERDFMAYAAGHLARQGLSDDEIQAKLVKLFEYGTKGVAQRTQLERTANFFFFPFSFEKTLFRSVGGYLLDNPGQRLLLTRGMAAYDDFNRNHLDGSNPMATSFWTKHLPIFQEASSLNAFAHGISPGEPGGVNRPLLNLFLPQKWSGSQNNVDFLKGRFVPAVKNFQRILEESYASGTDAYNELRYNMWRDLKGIPALSALPGFGPQIPRGPGNAPRPTVSGQAANDAAFAMQREWFTHYSGILDHNAIPNSEKIRFPISPEWGVYGGKPITKENIRFIIHDYYPSFDPNGAVASKTGTDSEFRKYLIDTSGSPLNSYVQQFYDDTKHLGAIMATDRYNASQVSKYTDKLRAEAIHIAEQDPQFYALYNKNFLSILGPLEKVR